MPMEEKIENEVLEEGFLRNAETGKIEPDYDGTIRNFSDGDIVTGQIVRVDRDEVLVDIGYKSEGVIPARELSIRYGVSPEEVVKLGDTIDALVLQKEDKDGRLILSKKRAEYERVWQRLDAIKEIDGTVKGQVIEVVKGGLIVDIGLRGFVPASLVDTQRVKDLKTYIGTEFECKIVELNRSRNNVVLSRRAFLDTLRKEEKKQLLEQLEPGQTVKGTVSSIVSFGAFVDIGGIDGLVHISELSWGHVDHPSEVLAVGDEVTVQILNVEKDRNRVSLGLKQCQPDPWKETVKKLVAGEIVTGTVMKIVPFGAFVSVADGVEGLIHISELADSRVEFPGDIVDVGQIVQVKVVDIELERHRLSLSLKQASAANNTDETEAEAPAAEPVEVAAEPAAEEEPVAAEPMTEEPVEPAAEAPEAATSLEEAAPLAEPVEVAAEPAAEAIAAPDDTMKESAIERTLRDVESVGREVEPIDAAELTSPDLMASAEQAPAPAEPEAVAEESKPKKDEPAAEPGTLEAILEEMKKETKG